MAISRDRPDALRGRFLRTTSAIEPRRKPPRSRRAQPARRKATGPGRQTFRRRRPRALRSTRRRLLARQLFLSCATQHRSRAMLRHAPNGFGRAYTRSDASCAARALHCSFPDAHARRAARDIRALLRFRFFSYIPGARFRARFVFFLQHCHGIEFSRCRPFIFHTANSSILFPRASLLCASVLRMQFLLAIRHAAMPICCC